MWAGLLKKMTSINGCYRISTAEHQSWLDRLLAAVSDEAERLATGDPQGFASRVAYLSPAPHNNDGPDDDKTDEG